MEGPLRFECLDVESGVLVLRLHGELDAVGQKLFDQILDQTLSRRPAQLDLDLSGLAFIDSTGIRCLLRAKDRARAADITIRFRDANEHVRRPIEVLGLSDLLF